MAYNGNPRIPADRRGGRHEPAELLQTCQIGHIITKVRGLQETTIHIELIMKPKESIWFETYCLDLFDAGHLHRSRVRLD